MAVSRVQRRRQGLTLIEVMVAVLIIAVVTNQALGMLQSQLQTYHQQKRVLDTQEDARIVADMILVDLRMAGFMVNEFAGIATVDGGGANPDRLCVSDRSQMNETQISNATTRFDRASLGGALNAGNSSVTLVAAEMDIDDDGDDDFTVGSGIIVGDGTESHCGRITNIAANLIQFTPATPVGFVTANARAVPAVVYEIDANSDLLRNNILLTTDVEDLQLEFDVDQNDDGLIGVGEQQLDSLSGMDHTKIMQVYLYVLTRTSLQDTQMTGGTGRQALANRAGGAADEFRRRLVSLTAAPRNLL